MNIQIYISIYTNLLLPLSMQIIREIPESGHIFQTPPFLHPRTIEADKPICGCLIQTTVF